MAKVEIDEDHLWILVGWAMQGFSELAGEATEPRDVIARYHEAMEEAENALQGSWGRGVRAAAYRPPLKCRKRHWFGKWWVH